MNKKSLRVAIVHDWLASYSGGERVLEQMLRCYPDADLYALVDLLNDNDRRHILGKTPRTSFLQRWAFVRKHYRNFLLLMPLAVEQFDMSQYDLVISSSSAVAKGVITGPDQLHICMCYSPIRYAWDLQHEYLREAGLVRGIKAWIARWMLHKVRLWDYRTAHGVDHFIAISSFISRRIKKVYARNSTIIYPPVDLQSFSLEKTKQEYYVTVSRMVPYKRVDLLVEAFALMPDRKLIVVGSGPDFAKIAGKCPPNVLLRGHLPMTEVISTIQNARAFLFAAEEDFGIAPVEAQACGTPVIAYGKGGSLETIRGVWVGNEVSEHATGVFFGAQSVTAVTEAVDFFEVNQAQFSPEDCRANAIRFSAERFQAEFTRFVELCLKEFEASFLTSKSITEPSS